MEKNWNNIGCVTVKHWDGKTESFDCIEHAVFAYRRRISSLKYDHLKTYSEILERNFCLTAGDDFVFLDELGLIIPVWKIKEVYKNLPNDWFIIHTRWLFRDPRHRNGGDFYRNSPVPCIRKGWSRRYSTYRYPKTLNETKQNCGFVNEYKELVNELKIKIRKRCTKLPTSWDDDMRSDWRDKSWKRFRKHQWK